MSHSPTRSGTVSRVLIRLTCVLLTIAILTPLALRVVVDLVDPYKASSSERSGTQDRGAVSVPLSRDTFAPIQVVPRMPMVEGFEIVAATDAKGRVEEDELVLAVEIDGQARAWPLNIMTGPEREVFNDQLGDRSIAATW